MFKLENKADELKIKPRVTVASFKGGVGKTTTALHLAAYLQTKAPALLVNGGPQPQCVGLSSAGFSTVQSSRSDG